MDSTEERTRPNTALVTTLFQHSPDALFLLDPLTERVLDTNAEAMRLTDLGRDDLVHVSIRSLVRHEQEWQDWLSPGKDGAPLSEDFLLRARPPRPWVPVALWLRRLQGSDGEPLVLLGLRDRGELIDARRRARAAEAERRRALASAPDCLFCCQAERAPNEEGGWRWRYRYLSQAAEVLTGRPLSHLLESPGNWRGAVAPADRTAWSAFRARLVEGRGGDLTYHLQRFDGALVRAREQATVTPCENGWVVYGVVTAIPTPPRETDPDARQRALEGRCEGISTLAGGVAHDLNNLITGVLGHVSLARLTGDEQAGDPAILDHIEAGALRAAELSKQLSLLAGKARAVARPLDLNEPVREAAAAASLPARPRVEPGELPPIPADRDGVRAAVEQLLRNAGEAAGDRSEVVVRTYLTSASLGEEGVWLPHPPEGAGGPWAVVEVRDSGPGIAPEVLGRIFDPFFTTRPGHRGLGLAVALGAARAHRGLLHVRSTPGDTRVRLLLPAQTAPIAPKPPSAQGTAPPMPAVELARLARATILLADDEDAIRDVVTRLLEPLGCRVLCARDGEEAIACFRRHEGLTLALVDLTMPRLGGETVLRELRRLAPRLPIVLMSGLPEGDVLPRFADLALTGYLQKPFRLPALLEVLGRALLAE